MSDSEEEAGQNFMGRLVASSTETRDLQRRRQELSAKRERAIRLYNTKSAKDLLLDSPPENRFASHVRFACDEELVAIIPFRTFAAEADDATDRPATVSPTNVFNALRGLFSPVKRLPAQPENVLPFDRHGDQEHDDEDQDDDRQHDRQQQHDQTT